MENLLFFARNYPKSFQELLRKQNGDRAIWEYPFAVAGVNITFMLIQMLDLQAGFVAKSFVLIIVYQIILVPAVKCGVSIFMLN